MSVSPAPPSVGGARYFLDEIRVEAALLAAVASHRPVGTSRHWNMLPVLRKLQRAVEIECFRRVEEGLPALKAEPSADDEDADEEEDDNDRDALAVQQATAQSTEPIWGKLEQWYDLSALNELVCLLGFGLPAG